MRGAGGSPSPLLAAPENVTAHGHQVGRSVRLHRIYPVLLDTGAVIGSSTFRSLQRLPTQMLYPEPGHISPPWSTLSGSFRPNVCQAEGEGGAPWDRSSGTPSTPQGLPLRKAGSYELPRPHFGKGTAVLRNKMLNHRGYLRKTVVTTREPLCWPTTLFEGPTIPSSLRFKCPTAT